MNGVCGPNVIGLRRAGYDSFARMAIRRAIKTYFFKGLNATNALAEIEKTPDLLRRSGILCSLSAVRNAASCRATPN